MAHLRPTLLAFAFTFTCPPAAAADPAAETYPLDQLSRTIAPRGAVPCPKVDLVTYRGTTIQYQAPVRVHPAFTVRLARFEEVVRDVAVEVYGRAPARIHHLGTYQCRRIGGYPELLSEHAFGNGIDVTKFEFSPLSKSQRKSSTLPAHLKAGFTVSVLSHWATKSTKLATHSRFLRTLAKRLQTRKDIFRVLLGPGYPGHNDHFHLDAAPYRLVHFE